MALQNRIGMIVLVWSCLAVPVSLQAQHAIDTTSTKSSRKQSLRELFWEFLRVEEAKLGREQLLQLPKEQLFQRFLDWQKLRVGN